MRDVIPSIISSGNITIKKYHFRLSRHWLPNRRKVEWKKKSFFFPRPKEEKTFGLKREGTHFVGRIDETEVILLYY